MKIAIVGTGYVGLVTGACFAEMGTDVSCVDIDESKVKRLRKGELPIYEPGLDEMVTRNVASGRLHFTTDIRNVVNGVDVLFCAVGTPPEEDGSADLSHVLSVAHSVGKYMDRYILLVTKSTVPVGTSLRIKEALIKEQVARKVSIPFDIASNPEFLKEGAAIKDFMSPDRVVVGIESDRAKELMNRLYRPFMLNNFRVLYMDVASAEMTKYAANAMLATRISFMNDIANLCERVGADVNMVRTGMGSDIRIGSRFLYAGCGYGGSCFPKDIKALIKTGSEYNYPLRILEAVEAVNEDQKQLLFTKLMEYYEGDLCGKHIALWGLAFKPETDDIREAPSLILIHKLVEAGCTVTAYDPVAMPEATRKLGKPISYADDIYSAVDGADALLVVTEWKVFRMPAWTDIKERMRHPLILDGRNLYDKREIESVGFTYQGVGR
ncbi:MAG: UDP-glucose/GDP-mannose dehydrogenase family protein [Tannerellaceae bacterium]|jgi:UDPglucose 6-dehydrogenase|nr:UDP-glucose/GDP-mannose dehydrogenase family protein [Tannerellaceae bacterium]